MTQTTENQLTQEELLLKLQEQIESLTKKQDELLQQEQARNLKEIERSKPLWQKLNNWRKEFFGTETNSELKPKKQELETKPQFGDKQQEIKKSPWENKKNLAIGALAILGIGGATLAFQNYNSPENQNQRAASAIIQESFGVNGSSGLSQKIEAGNLGQFSDENTKNAVSKSFKLNLDAKLKLQKYLTALQIKEIIPEVLNETLLKSTNIQGIDPKLQQSNQMTTNSFGKPTNLAAEHWRDKLTNQSVFAKEFEASKINLKNKQNKIRQKYSNLEAINLSNPTFEFYNQLRHDKMYGVKTDLHLVGNMLYIGTNHFQRLSQIESSKFSEFAGRKGSDKNFSLLINNELFYVKGSVVNPPNSITFTTKGNKYIIPTAPKVQNN